MQKKIILFSFSLFFTIHSLAQVVIDAKGTKRIIDSSKWSASGSDIFNKNASRVGVGTAGAPQANAALEVRSTNKGLLIPRLALISATSPSPLAAHVAGMIIYNIATTGTAPNNVSPGFYYNDGVRWQTAINGNGVDSTKDAWTDDHANTMVKLRTLSDGSTVRPGGSEVVIKDNGRVGIGTSNPSWLFDVQGGSAIGQFRRITNTSYDSAPCFLFTRAGGTVGSEADISSADFLGKVQFRGRIAETDTDYATFAFIANSPTAEDGRFSFLNGNGGVGKTELMTILSPSGNVGIGLTAPKSRLDINGYAKLGTADVAADALVTASDRAGMIRYNSNQLIQYHNNSEWVTVAKNRAGDIKQSLVITDHNGWIKMDGRAISTLTTTQQAKATALGFTSNLPNALNAYLVQNGAALGSVSGSNNKALLRSQLPNISLTLTGTTDTTGAHTHTYTDRGATVWRTDRGSSNPIADDASQTYDTGSAGSHSHMVSGNTESINGDVVQTDFDITPRSLSVNTFVYLGF